MDEIYIETHFVLSPGDWEEFIRLLSQPPNPHPNLVKLMTEPSILERILERRRNAK